MRPTQISVLIAGSLAAVGCCDDTVDRVELSLSPVGSISPEYLWTGDTVTVSAQGVSLGAFCLVVIEDSRVDPSVFRFESTNPGVAALDDLGHLTAREPGETVLLAYMGALKSFELRLRVSPPVETLALAASSTNVAVGDTVVVELRAFDSQGIEVQQAAVEIGSPSDTPPFWIPTYEPEGTTPLTRTIIPRAPGSLTIRARTPTGTVRPSFASDSLVISVTAR